MSRVDSILNPYLVTGLTYVTLHIQGSELLDELVRGIGDEVSLLRAWEQWPQKVYGILYLGEGGSTCILLGHEVNTH